MKKLLFFLILTSVSCSNNNDTETASTCKLTKIKTITLIYDDLSPITYSNTFSGNLTLEYNNNVVSKVYGAFLNYPDGSSLSNWANNDNTYDEITYAGNTITVDHSANTSAKPYKKVFSLANNGQIMSKQVTNIYPFATSSNNFTYEYSGNTVLESLNGNLYRTYYFTNGNLQTIEQITTNFSGQINGKNVYSFENYDNAPNLLKGMFYINGAFYKAFSNNNFQKYTYQSYSYTNNQYVPTGTLTSKSFTLTYNSNNIASIFEQTCN